MRPRPLLAASLLSLVVCGPAPLSKARLWQSAGPAIGSCSQSVAFFGRAGLLDATHHNAYDTLICGLVTDGVWATLDVLYIFATDTMANANLNLVSSSYPITPNGSPIFTVNAGYTGVDASSTVYLDTGFNPVAAPSPHFILNSAELMGWSFTATQSSSNGGDLIGQDDGANISQIAPYYSTPQSYCAVNENQFGAATVAASTAAGSWVCNRTGASTYSLYHNGASVASDTATSTALINNTVYVLARHGAGGVTLGGGYLMPAASIGASLSPTQVSSSGGITGTGLVPRVCAFLTAVHGSC